MSDKTKPPVSPIILDPEEFNKVAQRLQTFLHKRVEKAREKKEAHPSDRLKENHIETAKEAFVFVHLTQLIEHMAQEITVLREMLAAIGEEHEALNELGLPEMFSGKKSGFLN